VVALVTGGGAQVEMARHTAYGMRLGLPADDLDSDGDVKRSVPAIIGSAGSTI
jgi:hypothetical protein